MYSRKRVWLTLAAFKRKHCCLFAALVFVHSNPHGKITLISSILLTRLHVITVFFRHILNTSTLQSVYVFSFLSLPSVIQILTSFPIAPHIYLSLRLWSFSSQAGAFWPGWSCAVRHEGWRSCLWVAHWSVWARFPGCLWEWCAPQGWKQVVRSWTLCTAGELCGLYSPKELPDDPANAPLNAHSDLNKKKNSAYYIFRFSFFILKTTWLMQSDGLMGPTINTIRKRWRVV